MKHSWFRTLILILLFLGAQFIGLVTISRYIDIHATSETGITTLYEEKYLFPPPSIPEQFAWAYILVAVAIGTGLALLIIHFRRMHLWKLWFFLSVFLTLSLGFFPYLEWLLMQINPLVSVHSVMVVSLATAFIFAVWKLFFPNVIVYNFTELFVYSGIGALLVPILNMTSVIILLLVISVYDVWAVFRTKHMVSMAKFQTKANTFAGLMIPGRKPKQLDGKNKAPLKSRVPLKSKKAQAAILGGGDIAFPLLFSGVVMKSTGSLLAGFIISIFAAIGLTCLFLIAKKDKFYPAMPFITAGCLIGLALLQLF